MWIIQGIAEDNVGDPEGWVNLGSIYHSKEIAKHYLELKRANNLFVYRYRLIKCEVLDD